MQLDSKTAFITGAAKGIGLAITLRLLASGAAVSLWDRDAELLETTLADLIQLTAASKSGKSRKRR